MKKTLLVLLTLSSLGLAQTPKTFTHIKEKIPTIELEIRYFTKHNFVGAKIEGYLAPTAILTNKATLALAKVQNELTSFGLGLKVFDAYRPQRAVDHFVRWGRELNDTKMKAEFYPTVEKRNLFRDGYIAKKSGHSRGSTVDLTIVDLDSKEELDMGSVFDFFGEPSWVEYKDITAQQRANRMLLHEVMLKYGFKSYAEEWWHFTLRDEPYKNRYFDFVVE